MKVGVGLAAALLAGGSLAAAEPPGTAQDANLVREIKVLPDRAPDCSSLSNIVASVTRGCKSNDAKMMAIDNFMRISHYHRQYPPAGPALLWFNNYGWSLCGGLAGLQCSLYSQIPGWGWRHVGWPGHNMSEAYYDGAWHWVDCFLKFHAWRPDPKAPNGRTIACQDDLAKDPTLVNEAMMLDPVAQVVFDKNDRREMIKGNLNWTAPAILTCGDGLDGIMGGVSSRRIDGEHGPEDGCKPETDFADVNLRPGLVLENTWDQLLPPEESWPLWGDGQPVGHSCKNKDLRNDPANGPVLEPYYKRVRSYSNGRLIFAPDFSSETVLQSFVDLNNVKFDNGRLVPAKAGASATVTIMMKSPYVFVKASGLAEGADSFEVSDDGKTFRAADIQNFTPSVKGKLAAYVRVGCKTGLKSLRLEAIVMNNAGVLPFLSPGKNAVTVSVADPKALGANKLVVTYAYEPGYRTRSFEELFAEGKNLFDQSNATWSKVPTVVQKTFMAKDLPATFDIDVPTPKNRYPVYPRMLFVRREVLTPTATPLPLPPDAREPRMDAGDELQTLPNPFLIGTQPPPGHVEPPRMTNVVATLNASHAVCIDGETATNHFIRWPPDSKPNETWIMLVGGEIKGLPDSKEMVKATLDIPIVRGKSNASTKVCVVALKTPFEAGKPYDFANLGDTVGTIVVPKQKGADYLPPRIFRVNLTPYVKQLARGEAKFNGFAIRVQQDRNVDEGYLIRVDMPKAAELPLEIETLVKTP
jgi:hypothetical protein